MAEDKAISIHKFRNPEQALLMLEETGLYQDFMSADSEESFFEENKKMLQNIHFFVSYLKNTQMPYDSGTS